MGDAERDIFWLGLAFQSLITLGITKDVVKGTDGISQILGETIAALRRIEVSGNLLTQIETWANHFRDNYGEHEHIRDDDVDRFVDSCRNWVQSFSDRMRERFSHPKEIYEQLKKIGEIHDAIKQIQTTEHQFVCTSPNARQIKEYVSKAIENSTGEDEILLTGYFDNALVDKISNVLSKGVQVKLIVPFYNTRDRDNINATRRVKRANAQVRQHDTNHARLMIFGTKTALISSADPKTDGLDQNYEAGIWTTNRTIIQQCREFFDVLWSESVEWNM